MHCYYTEAKDKNIATSLIETHGEPEGKEWVS